MLSNGQPEFKGVILLNSNININSYLIPTPRQLKEEPFPGRIVRIFPTEPVWYLPQHLDQKGAIFSFNIHILIIEEL